jgi:hypothetical protein
VTLPDRGSHLLTRERNLAGCEELSWAGFGWPGVVAKALPQVQLPLFPVGTTHLNDALAFECHDGQVTYFNGHLPVVTHAQNDLAACNDVHVLRVLPGSAASLRRAS